LVIESGFRTVISIVKPIESGCACHEKLTGNANATSSASAIEIASATVT